MKQLNKLHQVTEPEPPLQICPRLVIKHPEPEALTDLCLPEHQTERHLQEQVVDYK